MDKAPALLFGFLSRVWRCSNDFKVFLEQGKVFGELCGREQKLKAFFEAPDTGKAGRPFWKKQLALAAPKDFMVQNAADGNLFVVKGDTGFVGVGASVPAYRLDIGKATDTQNVIRIVGGNQAWDRFQIKASNADLFEIFSDGVSPIFAINGQTGNVGIGLTSPTRKLHVAGDASITSWLYVGGGKGGTSGVGIEFPSTNNDRHAIYGEHDGGDTSALIIEQRDNTTDSVKFRQVDCCGAGTKDYLIISRGGGIDYDGAGTSWSSQRPLVLTNAGRVGIGTTSPSQKLDVAGTVKATDFTCTNCLENDELVAFSPGSCIIANAPQSRYNNSSSYTKVKEIQVTRNGTVTVSFKLQSSNSSVTACAMVYKNDSPVGTERCTTSTSWQTYSENFSVSNSDKLQLYVKEVNTSNAGPYVKDFKVMVSPSSLVETSCVLLD